MAGIGAVPAALGGLALVFDAAPESPRWLASAGRADEARVVAEALFGFGETADEAVGGPSLKKGKPRGLASKPVFVGVGVVGCFVATGNNVARPRGSGSQDVQERARLEDTNRWVGFAHVEETVAHGSPHRSSRPSWTLSCRPRG